MTKISSIDPRVPAVILGAGANGLGVARSLARASVPVWLLDTDRSRPEMSTRAAKPLIVRALQGESLIEDLERLAATVFRASRPVVFLTQEETVSSVSRQRERLARHYRFALPTKEAVEALQHKQGFQRLAEKYGAAIPPLVHIKSLLDLSTLERMRYPVVIKPGERHAEYGHQFKKAYRVESASEANALLRRILAVTPDVVVQEWIEGPDSNIYFCLQYLDRTGHVTASFAGRKIRSWPPQVGGTASCAPAPEVQEELSDMTGRFFQAVGVIGMASMEYKRDARSGEFRMVEPTIGRTDYQEEVAALNGVNLPFAAYCSELGVAFPAPVIARRPVAWRVRSEDVQSAALQGQRLSQGFTRGGRVADALWRWSDPLPFLVQNWAHIRHALRTRATKMMSGSRPAGSKT